MLKRTAETFLNLEQHLCAFFYSTGMAFMNTIFQFQVKLYEREQAERDRHELLHTRFTTNAQAANNGTSNGDDTQILIDAALNHQGALGRSRQGVEELIMQGQATLSTLRDQRGLMKNIKKKMLDISSMLGMSNTVMRLIERRSEGDKYLLFGGMIVTCVIMYLVVKIFT